MNGFDLVLCKEVLHQGRAGKRSVAQPSGFSLNRLIK